MTAFNDDPAAASVVAALEDDPFYRSISAGFEADAARRRDILARYFTYSIQEAYAHGRCVRAPDPSTGIAAWLLPLTEELRRRVAADKRAFLQQHLSATGNSNYHSILEFMSAKSAPLVSANAWYLSIIAVAPEAQGHGLGQLLLAPTLAEADASGAATYLETFTLRNLSFYQRLGFSPVATFHEPTVNRSYHLLIRKPELGR